MRFVALFLTSSARNVRVRLASVSIQRGLPDARYRDPALRPAAHPGRIPGEMVDFARRLVRRIRWTRADVERFVGEYLTQPKAHVVFRAARGGGGRLRLDPKTQLLYGARRFFINGESFTLPPDEAVRMRELADRRVIAAPRLAKQARLIAEWIRAGWAHREEN